LGRLTGREARQEEKTDMKSMQALQEHLRERPLELDNLRRQGVKLIGHLPGDYLPEELIYAAGAIPVGLLRGGSSEPIAASMAYVPRFLDTFCRSQIGHRMTGDDPLYQMIDLLVVPVTDNNIRAVADAWNFYTDTETFKFGVPHDKEKDAFDYYLEGLHLLTDKLEQVTGNKIADDALREAILASNRTWQALDKLSLLRKSPRPGLDASDFLWMNHATFWGDRSTVVELLEAAHEELKDTEGPTPKARLLLIGSSLAMGDYKILELVQQAGGAVVMEEFAEGVHHYWERINPDGDPMEALADRYFRRRVPPAWSRPTSERVSFVRQVVQDRAIDAVVWYELLYRDGYDIHSFYFEKMLEQEMGLKMLKVVSDYDTAEIGPLRTRVEAFIEMIAR
jgi:benzoyl-CoA reductase/2-hydroxyglutaryl-CoA dehydratase subunit BcrC/BadD/HgdB